MCSLIYHAIIIWEREKAHNKLSSIKHLRARYIKKTVQSVWVLWPKGTFCGLFPQFSVQPIISQTRKQEQICFIFEK